MKALVFQGPNKKEFIDKPKPKILTSTDVIVKVTHTTICGTDLHILKGDVPEVPLGLTLGHEGVGIVDEIGDGVTNFKKGDKVVISCITSCAKCENCKRGLAAHCTDGGWLLGHLIDGVQAEYVRIPHGDNSLHRIPDGADEKTFVMLSDALPTGYEIGVLSGKVFPGSVIAIIGAGPVGLSALLTAQFYSPAQSIMVDMDDFRLDIAKKFGATHCINPSKGNVVEQIMKITESKGVDIAMEAVGIPSTWDVCQSIIRPGGTIANVGVHGKCVDFHIEQLWIKNITITTGLVSAHTTPLLLKSIGNGMLKPQPMITHHYKLDDILEAYEVFSNASKHNTIKLIMTV